MSAKKEYKYGQTIGDYGCTYITSSLKTGCNRRAWLRCCCGKEFESIIYHVASGKSKSCGCRKVNVNIARCTTHGLSHKHPLYVTWSCVKDRCINASHKDYESYGGRGITICDRWLGEDGFLNFLEDMGEKASPSHTLDRIENDQGYSKENCRWATRKEQNRNTRRNVFIEYQGDSRTLPEWSELLNINLNTLKKRIYRCKWSIEKAFNTPVCRG